MTTSHAFYDKIQSMFDEFLAVVGQIPLAGNGCLTGTLTNGNPWSVGCAP